MQKINLTYAIYLLLEDDKKIINSQLKNLTIISIKNLYLIIN